MGDGVRAFVAGGFAQRVLTLPPGQSRPFAEAEWVDAIVLVATGVVDVEGVSGSRQRFERGDLLWLAGLPVRALRNAGDRPAVLVAVSRPARAFVDGPDPLPADP